MKKTLTCISMFWVAWALANDFALPNASLPIGSTRAINEELAKEISWIGVWLSTERTNAGISMEYDQSMGSVSNAMATNLIALCESALTQSDAGTTGMMTFQILFHSPVAYFDIAFNPNPITYDPTRNFTVWFDSNGKAIIPFAELFAENLTVYLPIRGVMNGVRSVEHVVKAWSGASIYHSYSPNGLPTNQWCYDVLKGDGVLYLRRWIIDHEIWPDWFSSEVATAEIILHYSGGGRDVFDIFTGEKTHSTVVLLSMSVSNNAPYVNVIGWPETEVSLQISSDQKTWTPQSTVVLDGNGKAACQLPASTQPIFVRGRVTTFP